METVKGQKIIECFSFCFYLLTSLANIKLMEEQGRFYLDKLVNGSNLSVNMTRAFGDHEMKLSTPNSAAFFLAFIFAFEVLYDYCS